MGGWGMGWGGGEGNSRCDTHTLLTLPPNPFTQHGQQADLVEYIAADVSGENRLLTATAPRPPPPPLAKLLHIA